jgi:hypothetical protein
MYLYFDTVLGLAWSNDPESYDGSSIAIGRVSHARQVKGDDPDRKGYPGSSGLGLGVGLKLAPQKSIVFESSQQASDKRKQAQKSNAKDRESGR